MSTVGTSMYILYHIQDSVIYRRGNFYLFASDENFMNQVRNKNFNKIHKTVDSSKKFFI